MAKILLVEDDELVRLSLTLYLKRAGHSIVEAIDGHSALDVIQRESIDILVTDIIMPGMSGTELVRRLRNEHPDLPVIAISGGGRVDQDCFSADGLGAHVFLGKPFDPEELLQNIAGLTVS